MHWKKYGYDTTKRVIGPIIVYAIVTNIWLTFQLTITAGVNWRRDRIPAQYFGIVLPICLSFFPVPTDDQRAIIMHVWFTILLLPPEIHGRRFARVDKLWSVTSPVANGLYIAIMVCRLLSQTSILCVQTAVGRFVIFVKPERDENRTIIVFDKVL